MKKELIELKKTYCSLNAVYTEAANIFEFTITLPDGSALQTETKYSHGTIYLKNVLTDQINDRELFMKGIYTSYYYEEE